MSQYFCSFLIILFISSFAKGNVCLTECIPNSTRKKHYLIYFFGVVTLSIYTVTSKSTLLIKGNNKYLYYIQLAYIVQIFSNFSVLPRQSNKHFILFYIHQASFNSKIVSTSIFIRLSQKYIYYSILNILSIRVQ